MKYGVIEQMRQQYPVPPMCRFRAVSISAYYAWRKRPLLLRAQQESRLEAQVRAAHERTRETFGPERLQKDLAVKSLLNTLASGDSDRPHSCSSRAPLRSTCHPNWTSIW